MLYCYVPNFPSIYYRRLPLFLVTARTSLQRLPSLTRPELRSHQFG